MSPYQTIDEGYFNWLVSMVEPVSNINPRRTHTLLLEQMFKKDFTWFVSNDDNRVEDGKELRNEFLDSYQVDDIWRNAECSVLEMMIGLSRRLSFEGGGEADIWFWKLVDNLGLHQYSDDYYSDWIAEKVEIALDIMIDREYDHDGNGGLFPLHNTNADQREIEIWYQMSYYLLEGNNVADL